MNRKIHPVILCGGSGTRLWPSSRKAYPKQFAGLLGKESLFQLTLRRLTGPRFEAPLILTADGFRFLATDQAAAIGLMDARVVVEPSARDTAAAILTAALLLADDDPDALMLIAPSDHVIADSAAFMAAIDRAAEVAGDGALVTFGVTPDRAETGYGYLELPGKPGAEGAPVVLKSFREKPDAATAEAMLAEGRYLWNAGLFLFSARDAIAAFEATLPRLDRTLQGGDPGRQGRPWVLPPRSGGL